MKSGYVLVLFIGSWVFGSLAGAQLSDDSRALVGVSSLRAEGDFVGYRESFGGSLSYFGKSRKNAVVTGVDGSDPEGAARSFLDRHGRAFGLMSGEYSLELRKQSESDSSLHLQFGEFYGELPVFGSSVNVQVNDEGNVQSVFAKTLTNSRVIGAGGISLVPILEEEDAALFVEVELEERLKLSGVVVEPNASLMIYDPELFNESGGIALVWVMVAGHETRRDLREQVLIDADSGELVLHYSLVHSSRDRKVYNSFNTTADPGSLILTENTGASGDPDVNHAFEYLGDTYNYLLSNHGQDSLDDNGFTLSATVNFCDVLDCPYQNAFWDGSRIYFGEGYAAADDVVAHELVHGLTMFTSNLTYYSQSGAINESLSDIFGEFVDQTNSGGTDDPSVKWLMGEDIPGTGAFRNMKDPTAFGDPDRQCSPYYQQGLGDNQGVHINSGVINKLAYLLVDGDTFNGVTVDPMGISAVSNLFFYCEANLLGPSSDFDDLYDALIQATMDLNFSFNDRANVESACQAVELTNIPGDCYTPPGNDDCVSGVEIFEGIDVEASNYNSTDSLVSGCTGGDTSDVWFDYTPNLSGTYSISTLGSFLDTTLTVYDGCGGNIVQCNDDFDFPTVITSRIDTNLTSGQRYRIRVAGYAGDTSVLNLLVDYGGGGEGNWVDFGYRGTTTGEEDYPYKFLFNAVDDAVGDGSVVLMIKGDSAQSSTGESGLLSKAMTLSAVNGSVILGAVE